MYISFIYIKNALWNGKSIHIVWLLDPIVWLGPQFYDVITIKEHRRDHVNTRNRIHEKLRGVEDKTSLNEKIYLKTKIGEAEG